MTFLLTKLVALKDFNTLTSFATSSARYDGTLPFRAVLQDEIHRGIYAALDTFLHHQEGQKPIATGNDR